MVAEFAAAHPRAAAPPRTDGAAGLRVLSVLEAAATQPARSDGALVGAGSREPHRLERSR